MYRKYRKKLRKYKNVYIKIVKNGSPLYTSILNKCSGAIPAFKKKPNINKKSHKIMKIECAVPGTTFWDAIIAFSSKYKDVFHTNKETIRNNTSNTVLKKEIQNCVKREVINLFGAGFTISLT